jgi:hypothetical protein
LNNLQRLEANLTHHLVRVDVNNPAPPPVTSALDAHAELAHWPRKRRHSEGKHTRQFQNVMLMDITDINLRVIKICPAPALGPRAVLDLILRLDASINPGLTEAEFYDLFAKCHRCGLVMTRRVFQTHECIMDDEAEVVDLTMEDD